MLAIIAAARAARLRRTGAPGRARLAPCHAWSAVSSTSTTPKILLVLARTSRDGADKNAGQGSGVAFVSGLCATHPSAANGSHARRARMRGGRACAAAMLALCEQAGWAWINVLPRLCSAAWLPGARAGARGEGRTCSKVHAIVTLYKKCPRALTLENIHRPALRSANVSRPRGWHSVGCLRSSWAI